MKRILFCGLSGYPLPSSAAMNRYVALAEAMSNLGSPVFVNDFVPRTDSRMRPEQKFSVYNVFDQGRPKSFVKRNLLKLLRPLMEARGLLRLHKEQQVGWINIYTESLFWSVYYALVSKILGCGTIFHYVERRTTFKRASRWMRLNDQVLEKVCPFIFDRYITISQSLDRDLRLANPDAFSLVVPPICDFAKFESVPKSTRISTPYFLYCGSAPYAEVIDFVVKSFLKLSAPDDQDCSLVLVVKGDLSHSVNAAIQFAGGRIIVMSDLDYSELIGLYKGALGLLVPLRPIRQDESRFPQKVCEYLAARGIIITTNVGEMTSHFRDLDNAMVADRYNVDEYARKLSWLLESGDSCEGMRAAAYRLGLETFSIPAYRDKLGAFLKC